MLKGSTNDFLMKSVKNKQKHIYYYWLTLKELDCQAVRLLFLVVVDQFESNKWLVLTRIGCIHNLNEFIKASIQFGIIICVKICWRQLDNCWLLEKNLKMSATLGWTCIASIRFVIGMFMMCEGSCVVLNLSSFSVKYINPSILYLKSHDSKNIYNVAECVKFDPPSTSCLMWFALQAAWITWEILNRICCRIVSRPWWMTEYCFLLML